MTEEHEGREIVEFADAAELRSWLECAGSEHPGVWVRLRRARSAVRSVTFHDLLEQGLAFGWSESTRHGFDDDSYLQRFAPRRTRGTASERNRAIAARLEREGLMTPAGRAALGPIDLGSVPMRHSVRGSG